MKKKVLHLSAFVVILMAILLSACSINSNKNTTDPNSTPSTSTTKPTNTVAAFGNWDCFVAPDPEESPDDVDYYESYDCTPGYLYFKKNVYGEVKPLFEKYLKTEDFEEIKNKVYVITEDNEVVKINKEDCSYETVYNAQYGAIDIKVIGREEPDSKYLYFDDGDYIVRLTTSNEKCEIITHSDNGISNIYGGGKGSFDDAEGCYFCDICGNGDEFFVWADNDDNYYWYHPETGTSEKVDGNLYFGHTIDIH